MAIPISLSNEISFYTENDMFKVLVMILFSIASTSVFCFIIDKDFEKQKKETTTETTNIKTPKRVKKHIQCPNAPKPKRQRLNESPIISPITPRELFSFKEDSISTPEAPVKTKTYKQLSLTTDASEVKQQLFKFNMEEKEKEEKIEDLVCPNAPKKDKFSVSKLDTNDDTIDTVSTELNFNDVKLFSPFKMFEFPKKSDILSKESEFICSLYKPVSSIEEVIDVLNSNADMIDYTNPNRVIWSFNPAGITSYILTINHIYKSLKFINENRIVLSHSGNGKTSKRSKGDYKLIDKLFNTAITIQHINNTLTERLLMVYSNCCNTWITVPNSYIQACKLNRDALIIQRDIFKEVTHNMNLTPWSEW